MTRQEFVPIMAYIAAAIGKPFAAESAEVYFDLLGDLPVEVLQTAARRVVLQHKWATFPSVAELREAAVETALGSVAGMPPAEAWKLAWAAACKIDVEQDESAKRATAGLPGAVIEAMQEFGLVALTQASPAYARPQFLKIYEAILAKERREALLPASVKRQIASIGERQQIAGKVGEAVKQIGRSVEE
jgi:hypothetical protein